MSDYVRGLDRQQQLLFPDRIDDYVDGLEVEALGFKTRYSDKNNNGCPAFCPKLMLKLYIYGYNHKIRSSRHLARETYRNIELIWLLQGLKPTYKTIANFRKNNATALKNIFKEFVLLCRNINFIEGQLVALDGRFCVPMRPKAACQKNDCEVLCDEKNSQGNAEEPILV